MSGHKPDLAIVIGGGKPHGDPAPHDDEAAEGEDTGDPKQDAMASLAAALKSGDMAKAVAAFESMSDLCAYGDKPKGEG